MKFNSDETTSGAQNENENLREQERHQQADEEEEAGAVLPRGPDPRQGCEEDSPPRLDSTGIARLSHIGGQDDDMDAAARVLNTGESGLLLIPGNEIARTSYASAGHTAVSSIITSSTLIPLLDSANDFKSSSRYAVEDSATTVDNKNKQDQIENSGDSSSSSQRTSPPAGTAAPTSTNVAGDVATSSKCNTHMIATGCDANYSPPRLVANARPPQEKTKKGADGDDQVRILHDANEGSRGKSNDTTSLPTIKTMQPQSHTLLLGHPDYQIQEQYNQRSVMQEQGTNTNEAVSLEQYNQNLEEQQSEEDSNASISHSDEPRSASVSLPEGKPIEMSAANSRERRLAMNRATAKVRRDRKLQYLTDLEEQVQNMIDSNNMFIAQNNELRTQIVKLKNEISLLQQVGTSNRMQPQSFVLPMNTSSGRTSLPTTHSSFVDPNIAFLSNGNNSSNQAINILSRQHGGGSQFSTAPLHELLNPVLTTSNLARGGTLLDSSNMSHQISYFPHDQHVVCYNHDNLADTAAVSHPQSMASSLSASHFGTIDASASSNISLLQRALQTATNIATHTNQTETNSVQNTTPSININHQLPVSRMMSTSTCNSSLSQQDFPYHDAAKDRNKYHEQDEDIPTEKDGKRKK